MQPVCRTAVLPCSSLSRTGPGAVHHALLASALWYRLRGGLGVCLRVVLGPFFVQSRQSSLNQVCFCTHCLVCLRCQGRVPALPVQLLKTHSSFNADTVYLLYPCVDVVGVCIIADLHHGLVSVERALAAGTAVL